MFDVVSAELDGASPADVIQLLYRDVLSDTPYFVPPAVYSDDRKVSIRIRAPVAKARAQARAYVRAMGFRIVVCDGVDRIEVDPDRNTFVYRPRHRSVAYLQAALSKLVSSGVGDVPSPVVGGVGQFQDGGQYGMSGGIRGVLGNSSSGSSAPPPALPSRASGVSVSAGLDSVVFVGTTEQVEQARVLVSRLDVPRAAVQVSVWAYEVQVQEGEGSSLQLVAGALSSVTAGKLFGNFAPSISAGSASTLPSSPGSGGAVQGLSVVSPQYGGVVLNFLASNERFRLLTNPVQTAVSGTTATFNVGDSKAVQTGTSYAGYSGNPVTNYQYMDSGLIFSVTPEVHGGSIDVHLDAEISSFVASDSGSTLPDKQKRSFVGDSTLRSGDVALIAGLRSETTDDKRNSLPAPFTWIPTGIGRQDSSTEVLLVLRVERAGVLDDPSSHVTLPKGAPLELHGIVARSSRRVAPHWASRSGLDELPPIH